MRRRWPGLVALLTVLLAGAGGARGADPACAAPDVHRVTVPLDHARPEGPRFDLAYRLRPGTDPDAPVVIVLPGGPGDTLIAEDADMRTGGIPDTLGVVLTDPRGAGCNDDPALDEDRYFTSEFLARDVLAIVGALEAARGRPLDYILYGQSYGTVQATVAAALAARLGRTRPRALVLEGTLGRSYRGYGERFAAFQAEWRELREALPARWRRMFREDGFRAFYGTSSAVWADLVERDLMHGYRRDGEPELAALLADPLGLVWTLRNSLAAPANGEAEVQSRVLRAITCDELAGGLYPGLDLAGGELVLRGRDACAGRGGMVRPFDAADWPLDVPLIYVQGAHDPATPLALARHHFEAERRAPRWFLLIDRAAHAPLNVTLAVGDCREGLWRAIAGDLTRLPAAAAACDAHLQKAHLTVEYRAPEPG